MLSQPTAARPLPPSPTWDLGEVEQLDDPSPGAPKLIVGENATSVSALDGGIDEWECHQEGLRAAMRHAANSAGV